MCAGIPNADAETPTVGHEIIVNTGEAPPICPGLAGFDMVEWMSTGDCYLVITSFGFVHHVGCD